MNCEIKSKSNCNGVRIDKNCNIIVEDNNFNCNYVQVFIAKKTTSEGSTPTQTIIRTNRHQNIIFDSQGDGFYTICKLTIPVDESKPYYYKDDKFYHNIDEVTLQEIINVNPEVSEIQFEYIYYFSTCNLRKCFIKICQDIFNSQTSICNKSNLDQSLTYKRDLIWSALNVINYLVEMDQMEEAQRLLEEVTGCNGLCQPQSNSTGCGCN